MYDFYYKYLGVPFKFNGNSITEGYDCINLCCALAKDRGLPIKNINHTNETILTYSHIFDTELHKSDWKRLDSNEDKTDSIVVFKINGVISHVGYMVDNDRFVHIMEKSNVTLDRVSSVVWNRRVVGYYKYNVIE